MWNLEKVGDDYKAICSNLMENKKEKIGEEVLETFKETNQTLRLFYETFYDFGYKNLVKISENKNKIIERIYLLLEKSNNIEKIILVNLFSVITKTSDFCPSTVALNNSPNIN